MGKRKLKIVGLFVFVMVFAFTMAACDMVSNTAVEDTAQNVAESSETGDLLVEVSGIEMREEVGAQSVHFSRFTDFKLEFQVEHQDDPTIKYNKTINLNNDDILKDNLGNPNGDYSAIFTALKEGKYNVSSALKGTNINSGEEVIIASKENYEAFCVAGMKVVARFEIQQTTGDLNITVDQFPSEETGGELIEEVKVKLLDLDNETVLREMDFNYNVEDQNLLVEDLYPVYYTIVISWEGHGSVEEEIQARVIPGKITNVPITLYGSQLIVDIDWKAEPASPTNVRVFQNEEGFLISWDAVGNADSYNVLRKRTPYYHAHFKEVGKVEHTGPGRHQFQYKVLKPELFDIAAYNFQVVAVREHPDKDYDLTSDPASPALFELDRATAWGGDTAGEFGDGWWYYYDTEGPAEQTIYVNLTVEMGTVEVIENPDNPNYITLKMTIDHVNWSLQTDKTDEVVKVQGFTEDNLPDMRPQPAFFDYQYDFDELNVDGDIITIDVPAVNYRFYGIKLDVMGIIYGA